jgi:hypothetical protein
VVTTSAATSTTTPKRPRRITRHGVTLICRGPKDYVTEDGRYEICGEIEDGFYCAGPHPYRGPEGWYQCPGDQGHDTVRSWGISSAGNGIGCLEPTFDEVVRQLSVILAQEADR